jgi:hypothetical protein
MSAPYPYDSVFSVEEVLSLDWEVEKENKTLNIVQNTASSWIPNVIRSGARATDP